MSDDDELPDEESPEGRRRINWLLVAILAAVAAGVLLASSVWEGRWGDSADSADSADTAETAAADEPDAQRWCASQATYDAIRRELFRRAAQVRGSDEQAYARLADFAMLRVSGPVVRSIDDRVNSVTCSGTAVLNLPPGVAVSGGRSLSGDIDYMVQPAADGTGNVVRLGNADAITVPLATLSRPAQQPTDPPVEPDPGNIVEPAPADELAPLPEAEPPQPTRANPSFDCADARTRSEIAICSDPGLAALDRQMAARFNRSLIEADRSQRRLLERTRDRFLTYRDRCRTNQCIADTYRSRMREIDDIMADRWRG